MLPFLVFEMIHNYKEHVAALNLSRQVKAKKVKGLFINHSTSTFQFLPKIFLKFTTYTVKKNYI